MAFSINSGAVLIMSQKSWMGGAEGLQVGGVFVAVFRGVLVRGCGGVLGHFVRPFFVGVGANFLGCF